MIGPAEPKTLLARATAGEANTAFFYGRLRIHGNACRRRASRVRDLFNTGEESAACNYFLSRRRDYVSVVQDLWEVMMNAEQTQSNSLLRWMVLHRMKEASSSLLQRTDQMSFDPAPP